MINLKLLKKGIKINGQYFGAWYSPSSNNLNGNATITIKNYKRLPDEAYKDLTVDNDTEFQTDYIDLDRIRISPNSKYFNEVNRLAA